MNILLLYPQCPDSFWSFQHALRFISKKAAVPPLGLLTVSAMLPKVWNKKLVDMNVTKLQTQDILWADYVFISAMYIQKESVDKIIGECVRLNKKMVAGGPLFTQEFENYPQIDHFVLNEAEITLPPFLEDLEKGYTPGKIYQTDHYADLSYSPVPDYQLLSMKDYACMNVQVSRGCPFACDFCEITSLLGHKVRMKNTARFISELDTLYNLNWRGEISIVDDNLIGSNYKVKHELLPAIRDWMQIHNYPFSFNTQTSINLADDEELMNLMTKAGITSTFIGIETPDSISLESCNKIQNKNRDLLVSVKKIQNAGLQVSAGFIVGFDSDTQSVFQRQINFIQQSGIVTAMVGLLNAPKHTKLYNRLLAENRLTVEATGSNTDYSMNFVPKMEYQELVEGYKKIIYNIYKEKPYYKRVRQFMLNYNRLQYRKSKIEFSSLIGILKSIFIIGIFNKGRREYWKFFLWTLIKRPNLFIDAMIFVIYGYHFRIVYGLKKQQGRQVII